MVGVPAIDITGLWNGTPRDLAMRAPGQPDDTVPSYVYFIAAVAMPEGPIKIGSSARPLTRLAHFQSDSPVKLELLATCSGGMKRERIYHQRFAADRLHGEWFGRSEPLERLIKWHRVRESLWSTGSGGANVAEKLVPPARFELTACGLGNRRSIRLSYGGALALGIARLAVNQLT